MKLALLALALLLLPLTPYPEWAYYDCDSPAFVVVEWYDPPVGVGAMADGLLFVGFDDTVVLDYKGWMLDDGKLTHRWEAEYTRPAGRFELDFYVRNIHGAYFWATETLTPCAATDKVWLPQLTGG